MMTTCHMAVAAQAKPPDRQLKPLGQACWDNVQNEGWHAMHVHKRAPGEPRSTGRTQPAACCGLNLALLTCCSGCKLHGDGGKPLRIAGRRRDGACRSRTSTCARRVPVQRPYAH